MFQSIPLRAGPELAEAILAWRTAAGLSQGALADRVGTTQSAVSRWERGHDEPRLATLAAILRACDLTGAVVVSDGVDRAQIRQQLALSPRQRLEGLAGVDRLRHLAVEVP